MNVNLELQLLGGFSVRMNSQPIRAFRTVKTRALLAYLAVQPDQEHSRVKLATLFWGELPDAAAKTNLRSELSNLKSLLSSHPALEIERDIVSFHSALASTDVITFREGITSFLAMPEERQREELPKLAAFSDLYQGEFLAGLQLNDTIEFEDWQMAQREQLHSQMMQALKTLQMRYMEQGLWAELAEAARHQLALVPWTEAAHRNLMQALAMQGQLQDALTQFEKCRTILRKELGVEPAQTTSKLAARLRGRDSALPVLQHNLSPQMKTFVGREEELAQLGKHVREERLVTLLGIGGVGKSHLAQAVAQNALHHFADGVWFVPLANIEAGEATADRIALAIAAAVGFQVTDLRAPLAELIGYLRDKQMLVVLDNCEHIVGATKAMLEPLLNHSDVHVLATSRVRLMMNGEIPIQLGGLPAPEAYTLFVDRLRRIVPSFHIAGDEAEIAANIYRLCEQIAGLPLAIELAASWVEHYSVAEISQSISEIAAPPQQTIGIGSRHQTLSGIFEYSWQLLNERHQNILARLSIFRGGFDREAVAAVADCTLGDLSTLINHSLLQWVAPGRYDLHPLTQEFAARKVTPDQETDLIRRYSHHYLSTLVATNRTEWASRLLIDFENRRSAWQQAVQLGDEAILQPAVTAFGEFVAQFGLMSNGNKLFEDAVTRFGSLPEYNELTAQLLHQQSNFVRALHGLKAASVLQQRVLTLTNNRELLVKTHIMLVNYLAEVGAWEQVDFHSDQAERLANEASDLSLQIRSVTSRVYRNALHFRGDFAKGIARLAEMLALLDTTSSPLADRDTICMDLLTALGSICVRYGDYARAIHYIKENLAHATNLGHPESRAWILSDLAGAEEYAGLYTESLAHSQEALTLAHEIGSADLIGVLKMNLSFTLLQHGELEKAQATAVESVEILRALGHPRIEGQGRNCAGHALLALGRWRDAYAAYGEALKIWQTLEHPNRYEAVMGRAVAALHLDRQDEALASVTEVLEFIANNGLMGFVEPVHLLLKCQEVLYALEHFEEAYQVLWQANEWVQTIASRISNEAVRHAFLYNRPDNLLLQSRFASRAKTTRANE